MADNIQLNAGVGGKILASEDVGGVQYQRLKIVCAPYGEEDTPVSDLNPLPISFGDSSVLDAFGRLRVSANETIISLAHIYDSRSLFTTSTTTGTGAAVAHQANLAAMRLSVSNLTAGSIIYQTRQRAIYTPGKSQLCKITCNPIAAAGTGITKRLGMYDARDGFFLQFTSTGPSIGHRTFTSGSTVDTIVPRASWNIDPLDGSGPSGKTLDATKNVLLLIDYSYLGIGGARLGLFIDRQIVLIHEFKFSNITNGVYWSSPHLPLRWELINDGTGAVATMDAICGTIESEGGNQNSGVIYSIDRGTTALTTNNDTNVYPLLAWSPNAAYFGAQIRLRDFAILCSSTSVYKVAVVVNPTIVGTALSYSQKSGTACDFATPTNATTITGGTEIGSWYFDSGNANLTLAPQTGAGLWPGFSAAGVADQFVLAVTRITGTTESFYAAAHLQEQV